MTTNVAKADAKNRAIRTLIQGLVIDILIAVAVASHAVLTADEFSWSVLGLTALKTLLTTVASYVMRIKMGDMLLEPGQEAEPVVVKIGEHEMVLQRPGHADHGPDGREG